MKKTFRATHLFAFFGAVLFLSACSVATEPPTLTPTLAPTEFPTITPTATMPRPVIQSAQPDHAEVGLYGAIDITVKAETQKVNPYDARIIRLDSVFTAPDKTQMPINGFWDGKDAWHIRFTPSQIGEWNYQLLFKDPGGISEPVAGKFTVVASDLHGAIQIGKKINPNYSSHYLAYQDGTPFYGIGHADALNILSGFSLERGLPIFNAMKEDNENYLVWWPLYTNSPVNGSYDQYSAANMGIIDLVVREAEKKNIVLVFTIWDHPELRDKTHAWGAGQWAANGFSKLGDINSFFTSDEAWAWQENLYRYIIARWGYSNAIGMWMTVSEINGTNAYDQTNPWHEKVNAYFQNNDPYHHPTTASMSGDVDWPEGHKVMDVSQVHVYDFSNGSVKIDDTHASAVLAHWTELMWNQAEKPNWVGEYGVPSDSDYPEIFHNSNWAALASGAAMIPAEWNGGGSWGEMTQAMSDDIARLAKFVGELPLVKWNPSPLKISTKDADIRAWGVAGADGGLIWVQNYTLEGKNIITIRKDRSQRKGVKLQIQGLPAGKYLFTPYNTWLGTYAKAIEVTCADTCELKVPTLHNDMAFKIEKK